MPTKFKCHASGRIVSFSDPTDIESMRKETHYSEVTDEVKPEVKVTERLENSNKEVLEQANVKKLGRPKKQ